MFSTYVSWVKNKTKQKKLLPLTSCQNGRDSISGFLSKSIPELVLLP